MKICPNSGLCSINTKLICLTNKSHGDKLICDRTKREIHIMYEKRNHMRVVYLNISRSVQNFFMPP